MTDVTVKMLAGTAPQVTVTGMTLVVNPVAIAGVASVNGHTGVVTLAASDVGADATGTAAGLVTPETAARVLGDANPTLASLTRDSAGKVSAYTENGVAVALTRDATGRVSTITTGSTTKTITRDSLGRVVGVA